MNNKSPKTAQEILSDFFSMSVNTVSRERLLFHRLYFDLAIAAAKKPYHLEIFEPAVDREGYDIIVDDSEIERRFQLKARNNPGGASKWKVKKRLIRPSERYTPLTGISGPDTGLGGGLIVIEVSIASDNVQIDYRYFDYMVVLALSLGLLEPKRDKTSTVRKAQQFIQQLQDGVGSGLIDVPRIFTIPVLDPTSLLVLMGFHSNQDIRLPLDLLIQAGDAMLRLSDPNTQLNVETAHYASTRVCDLVSNSSFVPFSKGSPPRSSLPV